MKEVDLHIHSSYSDGYLTPEEIVEQAKKQGLRYISITDHDTIASQYITKKDDKDIKIIPGVEFSANYDDLELHILAYFIDIESEELNNAVNKLKESRIERCKEITNELKKFDIFIDEEDLNIGKENTVGRGNIAKAMVSKGYSKSFKDAFYTYLIQGKPAYVKGEKQGYREILQLINNCGGIAVLAHPGKIYRNIEIEKIIKDLKCYGLKGLEVYHPSHTNEQINSYYNYSKKYKMIVTGGSDFHGKKEGNITIGSQGISELLLGKILEFQQKR